MNVEHPLKGLQVLWTPPPGAQTAYPCVDCGLMTGNFCDGGITVAYNHCFASHRVPADYLDNEGQRTPLCSYCETLSQFCRFCRRVHSCTPPNRHKHWSGGSSTDRYTFLLDDDAGRIPIPDDAPKALLANFAVTALSQANGLDVSHVSGDGEARVCHSCGTQQRHMQKCASCRTTYYCGKKCQRADWARHKLTCSPDEWPPEHVARRLCEMEDASSPDE